MPPIYPFLFALYPVLALLSVNAQEIPLEQSLRSIVAALGGCALLYAGLMATIKQTHKAAAIASAMILLFFSYGHLYNALKPVAVGGVLIGRHRFLIPLFLLVLITVTRFVLARRTNLQGTSKALTLISAALLIAPVVSIVSFIYRFNTTWASQTFGNVSTGELSQASAARVRPDIYYIILDGYARPDIMLREVDLDVSDFVDFLEQRGFYVAQGSNANHNWTALSLSSSLNMEYVQNLGLDLVPNSYPGVFSNPIQHSRVRRKLEALGYEIVGFRSGYLPTELTDADRFLSPDPGPVESTDTELRLNAFESQLIHSTILKVWLDFAPPENVAGIRIRSQFPHDLLRQIILAQFEYLADVPSYPGPQFFFAHIVIPHRPYLFGPNGEPQQLDVPFTLGGIADGRTPGDMAKYRAQAIYTTARIQDSIDTILNKSSEPPIIILQSDHGPGEGEGLRSEGEGLRQRMAILNAYLLPPDCGDDLYPTITPVNTFRVLFNCVFGEDLELLEDHSYFSWWPKQSAYHFVLVDDELRP